MLIDEIKESDLTPGMRQYVDIKRQYRDHVVLFRMGDFYETFYDDAVTVSSIFNITLTSRKQGESKAPLAGIPYHALDNYLKRLVEAGQKVVLVEQLEDPKKTKGLVKRGVTRIITPGTILEDSLLAPNQSNFLMSLFVKENGFGCCVCDVSTGELRYTQGSELSLLHGELEKFSPAEVLCAPGNLPKSVASWCASRKVALTSLPATVFDLSIAKSIISSQFKDVASLNRELGFSALGAVISYVHEKLLQQHKYLSIPSWYSLSKTMVLDSATQQNLELVSTQHAGGVSLFSALNKTVTSMGARTLRQAIVTPLLDSGDIALRHDAVAFFLNDPLLLQDLRDVLRECGDVERLGARLSFGTINPKELLVLATSMKKTVHLKLLLQPHNLSVFSKLYSLANTDELITKISQTIKDEPATLLREGNIIREGVHGELDELRTLAFNAKQWLRDFEDEQREKTGIKSLKIKYNKVFGYFIEVTKANLSLVPDHYIRKQTQVNAERFITDELKDMEAKLLGAKDRAQSLEYDLYQELVASLQSFLDVIKQAGSVLGMIDMLQSFAYVSSRNSYVRPTFTTDQSLSFVDARHPVVERNTTFIPNSTSFASDEFLHIITGPNMAGKSTYLRQVALVALMAQIGSFVPAASVSLSVLDRIFTRVGAHDNLSVGESTFMVEMSETATILQHATKDSLVILDEVGRGTSTYDGFSLAWAIAEYLAKTIKSKTLFATHYHQLNALEQKCLGVKNYHSTVHETKDGLVFLRKISAGSTDKSFGIHVAKLAGLPESVLDRAKELMRTLEAEDEILNKMTDKSSIKMQEEKIAKMTDLQRKLTDN